MRSIQHTQLSLRLSKLYITNNSQYTHKHLQAMYQVYPVRQVMATRMDIETIAFLLLHCMLLRTLQLGRILTSSVWRSPSRPDATSHRRSHLTLDTRQLDSLQFQATVKNLFV